MNRIKIKGVRIGPEDPRYEFFIESFGDEVFGGPKIWDYDDDCPYFATHIAVFPDGTTIFDLGPASMTVSSVHVFKNGHDTGRHVPVQNLEIVEMVHLLCV